MDSFHDMLASKTKDGHRTFCVDRTIWKFLIELLRTDQVGRRGWDIKAHYE